MTMTLNFDFDRRWQSEEESGPRTQLPYDSADTETEMA